MSRRKSVVSQPSVNLILFYFLLPSIVNVVYIRFDLIHLFGSFSLKFAPFSFRYPLRILLFLAWLEFYRITNTCNIHIILHTDFHSKMNKLNKHILPYFSHFWMLHRFWETCNALRTCICVEENFFCFVTQFLRFSSWLDWTLYAYNICKHTISVIKAINWRNIFFLIR